MPEVDGSEIVDSKEYWDKRYSDRPKIWSGKPNAALVASVASLKPGRALDLGSGEGGDAIWLAEQGWSVTGLDISQIAIDRANAAATDLGLSPKQVQFVQQDLSSWQPEESFDLVNACFFHAPHDFPRTQVLQRAAASLAISGHLLIVGHASSPPWSQRPAHRKPNFLSPEEELAVLELNPANWSVIISDTRSRLATGPDGQQAELDDHVLLIQRVG